MWRKLRNFASRYSNIQNVSKMKRNIRIAMAALMLAMMATPTMAKVKTAKFNVNGRCARCGQRIETAAKAVEGVQTAQWDEVSKEMVVTFDSKKTSKKDIQRAIVAIGFTAGKMKPEAGKEKKHDANCKGGDDCKD